ncbi:MAG: zinc-ribbon domain-containing protein [Gammaproteobacteria bacterium]|nr:zinc-ribbon domain-containing protein [Gammaproteobacteria bacterium]
MQTRCPECNTLFKLNDTDLTIAEGEVQCGHCFYVFEADTGQDNFALNDEIDTSDIDINTFANSINDISDDFEDTSPSLTVTADNSVLFEKNPIIEDLVPPDIRYQHAPSSSLLAKSFWSVAIISLLLSACLQLIYFKRFELASHAQLRPYIISLCELADCEIPELRDLQRLELSSKNVYSHPNVDKALMITAVIVNQASFSQQFPTLQISFTNLVGDIIMARQFTPGEYLNTDADKLSDMQPGLPIQITLEVLDPGKNATAYEFSFI